MECTCSAARRELAEDAPSQAQLAFDDEVNKIVRQERIVARRGVHLERREPRSDYGDGVPTIAGTTKLNFHTRDLRHTRCAERSSCTATARVREKCSNFCSLCFLRELCAANIALLVFR